MEFKLVSNFKSTEPQHNSIDNIVSNINYDIKKQTLRGLTGTGKSFIMANVIEKLQRPTLIIAPNKVLVHQLYMEFKSFFPNNRVEFFTSHFDYFQPETYLPVYDKYIAKDSMINDELNRLRLSTVSALTSGRNDVIVVSSVSCIFGAGNPNTFKDQTFSIKLNQKIGFRNFLQELSTILYSREVEPKFKHGTFRVKGDTIILCSSISELTYRISFFGDEIETIERINSESGSFIENQNELTIYPNNIYLKPKDGNNVISEIRTDLSKQTKYLENQGKKLEALRLKDRTNYDLEMIEELGTCIGIENYGRYFDHRKPGERPFCLLDYFPDNHLMFIDESHSAIQQFRGMHAGNLSRKQTLVDYGFRLPSALDARPLKFQEFEDMQKTVIFVSATPGEYELQKSEGIVVEQLIRPTGILDPTVDFRTVANPVDDLLHEIDTTIKRGERSLVLTLSIKESEKLSEYFINIGIKALFIHSEIKTFERSKILNQLRSGEIDVLVGINLLREGLDLPEVSLVAILDADKEGFLRNKTSMLQTIGRAARNINGRVILYANKMTDSITEVINQTNRTRQIQQEYNEKHNIVPKTILKNIHKIERATIKKNIPLELNVDNLKEKSKEELQKLSKYFRHEMEIAAKELDFVVAAEYRDKLKEVETLIK